MALRHLIAGNYNELQTLSMIDATQFFNQSPIYKPHKIAHIAH